MRPKPLFIVIDRQAVFTAAMAPAHWVRGQRRALEWLGFPLRHSAWINAFALISPHLYPDQSLWGGILPTLLGEWTQQVKSPKQAPRKPGPKPSPAPIAETHWRKDFSTREEDKRRTRRARSRPPSSRIGQVPKNLQRQQRPGAFPSVMPHATPITDQASPAAEKSLPTVKPPPHGLPSRITESVLKKIQQIQKTTGEHINTLPIHATPRDKPFVAVNGAQTNLHPPVADHPTLRKNWQNGIIKRVLKNMKTLDDSSRNAPPDPKTLTRQWQSTFDGPQAPQRLLVQATAANSAREIPVRPRVMDKDSPGQIAETDEPAPTSPAARATDNTEVTREPPVTPNMGRRPERQPLPAAPGSNHTQPVPAESILDGLMRKAACGIPGITSESPSPDHDSLSANPPAPSEQTRSPLPLNRAQATADPSASDTGAAVMHPPPHREYAAAQSDSGDLAEQIKRILDDEARRHGIDV